MKRAIRNIILLSILVFIISAICTVLFKTYGISKNFNIPNFLKEPDRSTDSEITSAGNDQSTSRVTPQVTQAVQQISETSGKESEPDTPVRSEDYKEQEDIEDSRYIKDPMNLLTLVNKDHQLNSDFIPDDLVRADVPFLSSSTKEETMMRKEAASALKEMFDYAKKRGIKLWGNSGYRSYASQKRIYDRTMKTMGKAYTEKYVAVPGQSEHQTGLAIDVTGQTALTKDYKGDFGQTKEGIWLKNNAANYGFILRYPYGKTKITGYNYEPWHIRYVGAAAAKEIKKKGLVLEEYLR